MIDPSTIEPHMDVLDDDGTVIGRVDRVEGMQLKLTRASQPGGEHRYIPVADIALVDSAVHLKKAAYGQDPGPGSAPKA